jgi:hypothetical protein
MLCTLPPHVVIADVRVSEQREKKTCRQHEDVPTAEGRFRLILHLTLDELRMVIMDQSGVQMRFSLYQ